jgi:hypothetical protein
MVGETGKKLPLESLGIDGRIILKSSYSDERYALDSSSSGYGPVAGSCEHCKKL